MNDPKSAVQRQFGRQAGAYAQSASRAQDIDLSRLHQRLSLSSDDRVLDVATGTGFTALALHRDVALMIGLDLTHEMLAEAIRLAGLSRIRWVQGDAEELPFVDGAFTVVTCRRAAHHFPNLDQALAEMFRVLRPGGRLGLVDQVSPDGSAARDLLEHLERLRDPSHVRALTPELWRSVLQRHGFAVRTADVLEKRITVWEGWLARAGVDADHRRAIEGVLADASAQARAEIGYEAGAAPTLIRRWMVLIGQRLGRRE